MLLDMLWIFNELHLIKHKVIFLKVYICCLQVGSFCVNLCLFLVLEEQSYSKISLKPTIFFIWDTWFDINLYTYSFFLMCFLTGSRVYSLVLCQVIGVYLRQVGWSILRAQCTTEYLLSDAFILRQHIPLLDTTQNRSPPFLHIPWFLSLIKRLY